MARRRNQFSLDFHLRTNSANCVTCKLDSKPRCDPGIFTEIYTSRENTFVTNKCDFIQNHKITVSRKK
jgi:hypothetical protein